MKAKQPDNSYQACNRLFQVKAISRLSLRNNKNNNPADLVCSGRKQYAWITMLNIYVLVVRMSSVHFLLSNSFLAYKWQSATWRVGVLVVKGESSNLKGVDAEHHPYCIMDYQEIVLCFYYYKSLADTMWMWKCNKYLKIISIELGYTRLSIPKWGKFAFGEISDIKWNKWQGNRYIYIERKCTIDTEYKSIVTTNVFEILLRHESIRKTWP